MRIVLDTNVLYQALRDQGGASHYILQLLRQSELEVAVSVPVFLEYRDVLSRPNTLQDLRLSLQEIEAVFRFIAYIARPIQVRFLMRPHLRDENDNMFVDLAFASSSKYLITNNVRDFLHAAELKFDGYEVVTPGEFVRRWRTHNDD